MAILDALGDPLEAFADLEVTNDSGTAADRCGTDLLGGGIAWLVGQLQATATQPVVYRRGADAVALCAMFGRRLARPMLPDERFGSRRTEWAERDFLIRTTDLVLADTPVRPERGDRIILGDETYEVRPPYGEGPWRWSDPYQRMIRVHTTLIQES